MEAEKIIITKKYYELTSAELEVVSPLVSNEIEFDDMKMFLSSAHDVFDTQKISDTSDLDEKIFTHLNASPSTNRSWYNSFMLFLFPRDRRLYQYPAFQLAIATVLIFGVFNFINLNGLSNDKSMAYEDLSLVEETTGENELFPVEKEETEEEVELSVPSDDNLEPVLKEEVVQEFVYADNSVAVTNEEFKDIEDNVSNNGASINNLIVEVSDDVAEQPMFSLADKESASEENKRIITNGNVEEFFKEEEKVVESEKNNEIITISESVASGNSRSDNDRFLKKKDKDKVSKMSSPQANEYKAETDIDQVADESNVLPQKQSIKSTPELNQLFFEVK